MHVFNKIRCKDKNSTTASPASTTSTKTQHDHFFVCTWYVIHGKRSYWDIVQRAHLVARSFGQLAGSTIYIITRSSFGEFRAFYTLSREKRFGRCWWSCCSHVFGTYPGIMVNPNWIGEYNIIMMCATRKDIIILYNCPSLCCSCSSFVLQYSSGDTPVLDGMDNHPRWTSQRVENMHFVGLLYYVRYVYY